MSCCSVPKIIVLCFLGQIMKTRTSSSTSTYEGKTFLSVFESFFPGGAVSVLVAHWGLGSLVAVLGVMETQTFLILQTRNTKVHPPGVYSKWQQVNMHHLTFPPARSTVWACQGVKQVVVHINSDPGETRRRDGGSAAQLLVILLHLGPSATSHVCWCWFSALSLEMQPSLWFTLRVISSFMNELWVLDGNCEDGFVFLKTKSAWDESLHSAVRQTKIHNDRNYNVNWEKIRRKAKPEIRSLIESKNECKCDHSSTYKGKTQRNVTRFTRAWTDCFIVY